MRKRATDPRLARPCGQNKDDDAVLAQVGGALARECDGLSARQVCGGHIAHRQRVRQEDCGRGAGQHHRFGQRDHLRGGQLRLEFDRRLLLQRLAHRALRTPGGEPQRLVFTTARAGGDRGARPVRLPAPKVGPGVPLAFVGARKLTAAVFALERLLACVRAHVCGQVVGAREGTQAAGALERLLACVNAQMARQFVRPREALPAVLLGARVRLLHLATSATTRTTARATTSAFATSRRSSGRWSFCAGGRRQRLQRRHRRHRRSGGGGERRRDEGGTGG